MSLSDQELKDNQPSEGDKNMFLMLAMIKSFSHTLTSLQSLRAYHENKLFRHYLQKIEQSLRASMTAMNNFKLFQASTFSMTDNQKMIRDVIADNYLMCATLLHNTPIEKYNECIAYFENFRTGNYSMIEPEAVDAIQTAQEDPSAGLMILIKQFAPTMPELNQKAFANSIEHLIAMRQATNANI